VSVGVIALIAGWGSTGTNLQGAIVFLTGFFVALWLVSAWLFRKAAREQTSAGAAPQFDPQRPPSTQNRSRPTS
jgi:membrane protein implicated in regulation of membrane protease activity